MQKLSIKVMSFNLRYLNDHDGENHWSHRADKAVQMIRMHDPIIVCTQEVTPPMLQDLVRALPDYDFVGSGRSADGDGEHCAVFYKKNEVNLEDHGQFWLSEEAEQPGSIGWDALLPRICTWAQFSNEAGNAWFVFNTHLDHVGKEAKLKGMQLIWQRIQKTWQDERIPIILAGDMNSHPDSPAIQFINDQRLDEHERLVDAYSILNEDVGATAHGFKGRTEGNPIDYIFVSSNMQVEHVLVDRSKIDGAYPSDHYPVIAELSLIR